MKGTCNVSFIVLSLLTLFSLKGFSSYPPLTGINPGKARPNILIITVDDLTYNSVGAFGCKIPGITPNIDALARRGMRFNRGFINTAVCQPSRQAMLTGLYPHNNGSEGLEPMSIDVVTLPEKLKKAGYTNGVLGKEIHYQPMEKFHWDYIPFVTEKDSTWRKGNGRIPSLFYDYAMTFFKMSQKNDEPFFLVANSQDPHRPFADTEEDLQSFEYNPLGKTRQFQPDEIEVPAFLPDIPDVRKEMAQYYSSVYRADLSIGAILKALSESGMADNTLIVFMSDNGSAFPYGKSQCYYNSNRTPLIVAWPGVVKPGTVDSTHAVSGIDLMPTILDALQLPQEANADGESYLPLLLGKKQKNKNHVYTTYYQIFAKIRYPMRSVLNDRFSYIYNFWADGKTSMTGDATGGLTWKAMLAAAKTDAAIAERVNFYKYRTPEELYDYKKDPDALHNLIDDPAYQQEIKKLRKQMLKLMIKYKDPAYETYRDRNKKDVISDFMKLQKEKAKNTGKNILF
jgi:N-sulfoglucosamine sulfohydrolase